MTRFAIILVILVSACIKDETISGYVKKGTVYQLAEIAGQPFSGTATLTFPSKGKVAGNGPCNSFSADQKVPTPWFEIGSIPSTRSTCPDIDLEFEYFRALESMTLIEPSGPVLILRNDDGIEMLFHVFEE